MSAAVLAGAFALGATLGAAHFYSLWGSIALIGQGRAGLGVGLQGVRFGLLAMVLVVIARAGANLFIAAAAGLIVARVILTAIYRRRA